MNQYAAILIDPPWKFEVYSSTGHGRSAESHYPTMGIEGIKALPIPSIMADDCAVFMWVTWPTIADALALGSAWGLEYKTCAFLWAKTTRRPMGQIVDLFSPKNWHMGMGYWTRANTEPCLLFTKGSPARKAKNVRQLVVSAVRQHSQKPDCIYGHIESLVPGPYCEIFARQTWKGWAAWGNQVESSDVPIPVETIATHLLSMWQLPVSV